MIFEDPPSSSYPKVQQVLSLKVTTEITGSHPGDLNHFVNDSLAGLSGWWFGTWLLFSIIYGMSSTNQFSFFNYSWCKLTNFDTFSNSCFSFDLKLETCILFLELNIDPGEFGHKSSLWQRGRIF